MMEVEGDLDDTVDVIRSISHRHTDVVCANDVSLTNHGRGPETNYLREFSSR
jgi:hypothetical protein